MNGTPKVRVVGMDATLVAAVAEAGLQTGDPGELVLLSVADAGEAFVSVRDFVARGAAVVTVGRKADIAAAVTCMRAGASEHLEREAGSAAIAAALRRAVARLQRGEERRRVEAGDEGFLSRQVRWRRALERLESPHAESWLELLADSANASSGLLYLLDERGLLERKASRGNPPRLPSFADPCDGRWVARTAAASPFRDEIGLWLPLSRQGRLFGLVFLASEGEPEAWLTDLAVAALRHASQLAEARRGSLRDPASGACTLSYLVDQSLRESWRFRRTGRPFSLLLLRAPEKELQALVAAVGRATRDADLVARVAEGELAVLLPETDRPGAVLFRRRLRSVLREDRLLRDAGVEVSAGIASCLSDGDALEGLLAAARRDADAAEGSELRRRGLSGAAFWPSIERLLEVGFGCDEAQADAVIRHWAAEAEVGAFVFLGGEDLPPPTRKDTRVFLLGGRGSEAPRGVFSLPADAELRAHRFALVQGEATDYAFFRHEDGRAFHTADPSLVDHLIGALQRAYDLPTS